MGRLKRKRPASAKKKARKKAAKGSNRQGDLKGQAVAETAQEKKPALKRESVAAKAAKKETPKAIVPTGPRIRLAFWAKTSQFLREVKIELRKVTWPSKKEAMASTVVVIILVIIVSVFLGLVDVGLSSLIRLVLH